MAYGDIYPEELNSREEKLRDRGYG